MKKNKTIYRIDAVSRTSFPKDMMFRIVKTPQNVILIEEDKHIDGRGVYLKKDLNTIVLAQKKKVLSKGLRCQVDDSIYLELIKKL